MYVDGSRLKLVVCCRCFCVTHRVLFVVCCYVPGWLLRCPVRFIMSCLMLSLVLLFAVVVCNVLYVVRLCFLASCFFISLQKNCETSAAFLLTSTHTMITPFLFLGIHHGGDNTSSACCEPILAKNILALLKQISATGGSCNTGKI